MQNYPRAAALVAACIATLGCGLVHRSPDPNAPCPVPPIVAVARWSPTAQSGVIEGKVFRVDSLHDPAPQPLTDASILVTGTVQRGVRGDSTGYFRFVDLPAGDYVVVVRRVGYPNRSDSLRIDSRGAAGEIRLATDTRLFPHCCHSQYCL